MNRKPMTATLGATGALRIADLQIFVCVAKALSMSRAGRDLGLSPAVVSKHISMLEEKFGIELFYRTTRNMQLTDAGSLFLLRAMAVMESVQMLENSFVCSVPETDLPRGRMVWGEFTGIKGGIEYAQAFCDKTGRWMRCILTRQGAPAWVQQSPLRWSELPGAPEASSQAMAA